MRGRVALVITIALAGCQMGGTPVVRPGTAPPAPVAPALREAPISTVAEADGRILVEMPLGRSAGVEPGMFFRVLSSDGAQVKGMAQVTEVVDDHRAIARLVGPAPAEPPRSGDRLREISLLADVGAGVDAATRTEVATQDAATQADEARFTALREQYRRLLGEAIARHDRETTELRAACAARIAEVEAARDRAVAARDEAARAEIATVRSELAQVAEQAVGRERTAAAERNRQTQEERDRLRVQVDELLAAQQALHRRIETLIQERATAERSARAQVRAEIEAREQLAARLAELERRSDGSVAAATALLARDPDRDEGVLERLARLATEAATAAERARRAEAGANETQTALLTAHRQVAELQAALATAETRAAGATALDERLAQSAKELEGARTTLAQTNERLAAAELARLESERQLYDLAARVLRVPKGPAELAALQERLRALLGERADPIPDASAPERQP